MNEQVNPNQVNTSVLGMASAVFTSAAAAVVTTAVKSNTLIDKSFNVVIHGVSAAEHIAEAAEGRAKIYANGVVANGELQERETLLKTTLRLRALERQEEASRVPPATNAKPAKGRKSTTRKKTSSRKAASTK